MTTWICPSCQCRLVAIAACTTRDVPLASPRRGPMMNGSERAPTVPQRAPGTVAHPETSVPRAPLFRGARSRSWSEPMGAKRSQSVCPGMGGTVR
jgi:hypothetical protein